MKIRKKHEFHMIQHTQPKNLKIRTFLNPKNLYESIKDWTIFKDDIYHHHIRHIYFTRFNQVLSFNNKIFKKKIREIVKDYGIEIIVSGPNHYLHGFPPFGLGIPFIFDYVDYLYDFKNPFVENTKVLYEYYKYASKVLCVSKTLIDSIPSKYREKGVYMPNGVDLGYFQAITNYKKENDTKYISVIGLNKAESLFFLNVFPDIKKTIKDVKMVLVGGGIKYPIIKSYIERKKVPPDYILTGYIPYEQVRKYYLMTDVGLSPTLQNRYYDCQCPLKVMEYSAVSKPVVCTDVEELRRLNFPNVFLAKPNKKDFLEKIIQALDYKGSFPKMNKFDWTYLANKLEKTLKNI